MTALKTIPIAVTVDVVCPWCFIGKRRLEKAIKLAKDKGLQLDFKIEYLPFQLDPSTKTSDMKSMERLEKKFGRERLQQMIPYMKKTGLEDGISFTFGAPVANTFDAHRLIAFAKSKGLQLEVVEELFKDYFERDQQIGDRKTLAEAAARAGIDKEEALNFLNSTSLEKEVSQKVGEAYQGGVSGVPHFVIADRYEISGGQAPEVFLNVFEKLAK
ncbi:hypothetical protein HDU96_000817 [Phlyctochytrium bullatum]|nr:hypothetical protein HDU96_000817 [Phlyctochytrium bullatum]